MAAVRAAPLPSPLASGATDFAAVSSLTNLNEINRLLHETLAKERTIDLELDKLLNKRGDLEKQLVALQSSTAEMVELVRADGEGLAASVKGTSDLSERVSAKVRELDSAQSHVRQTLSRISVIVDRTNCIYGMNDSLEKQDYESATGFVNKFLELEERCGPGAVEDSKQAEQQQQILSKARASLEAVVREKLSKAIQSRQHSEIVRFTTLFKPLRIEAEGLREFSQYLCKLITDRGQQSYTALVEGGAGAQDDYIGTITTLFKDIAVAVEENEEFLRSTFGPESVLDVIQALQGECDTHGSRILQRYIGFRQFARLQKEMSHKKVDGSVAGGVDPREVEGYLEEMLLLCQRSEEYNQFVLGKMANAVAPLTLGASRENAFRGCQFNVTVRELINYYVAMEEYYMEQNVTKALDIREYVEGALITSAVDDVFFILQKCGRRALATGNVACVCAVLGQLNNLLTSAFYPQVQAKLNNGATRLMAAEGPSVVSGALNTKAAAEAAYFNDADISSLYVLKLRQELEELTANMFGATNEREQIKSVLSDLAKTSNDFKQLAAWALGQLTSATLSRLRPTLDEVAGVSYRLTETEYGAAKLGGGWVTALIGTLGEGLSSLAPLLTPSNYDGLVLMLLEEVALRLDAIIATKKFNALGGLQLDRDVRQVVAYSAELTQRPVRDKFATLTQKATILSLESVGEVLDYWGDSAAPLNWRLSEEDVRGVLRQRIDFPVEQINGLVL